MPTKSQCGMGPNIRNGSCTNTKNKAKLESFWKRPNSKFWLKQLTATHTYLATLFNKLIEEGQIPEWLMTGITILIPKNENTE